MRTQLLHLLRVERVRLLRHLLESGDLGPRTKRDC